MTGRTSLTQRIVEVFLTGNLAPLLLLLSLLAGTFALLGTPREEDPQIVVPVADVIVTVPGASALEVERQVTTALEQIVLRIEGIEHVYSTSRRGQAVVTARFRVGEDREISLVKLHSALQRHADAIPPQVKSWTVKPIAIDDVPIVAITLHGATADDHSLRRIGEELAARLQAVPDAGIVEVLGGRPRLLAVHVDPEALAARGLPFSAVETALAGVAVAAFAGSGVRQDRVVEVETSPLGHDPTTLGELVVGVSLGRPIHLREVARVLDGPAEPASYVHHLTSSTTAPAVTVAIAKRRGSNAVSVSEGIQARLHELAGELLPAGVTYTITRDSGATADAKVDELLEGLAVAIAIVVVLITMMLGWREAIVVALAVPITFALTLLVNQLAGYSINRVTLFALILALGLVVDDPIVDVENIHRHLARRATDPLRAVLAAVDEVRPPVIVATLAVILSFLPLYFITGMMGPYMRPMALNVPVAMLMSMVVAFTLTPWMSWLALRRGANHGSAAPEGGGASTVARGYAALVRPLLRSRRLRYLVLGATGVLFFAALALGAMRRVPLKMLPFDNKTELTVLVDLDEGTTLERTEALVQELAGVAVRFTETVDVTTYTGVPSPLDFNGMVRKYYLRAAPHFGELRIRLGDKRLRRHGSHEVALRLRHELTPLAERAHATLKIVELPPGPPVLATLVAEIRGPADASPGELDAAAGTLAARLGKEPGVVDLDTSVEAAPPELHFELDHEKAALAAISPAEIARVLTAAVGGSAPAVVHAPREVAPLTILVRLDPWRRADPRALAQLPVTGVDGGTVALGELGSFIERPREGTIHRKDLERVAYVLAEAAGRTPAEIVLDVQADLGAAAGSPRPLTSRSFVRNGGGVPWTLPAGYRATWTGEGEWKITLDAFRDLGLAFLVACFGIYVLLVHETKSYVMPLVLMTSIPFTILGILPGFWLLNALGGGSVVGIADPVHFTATAMIGMIALAGITVRNSILLIDFITGARKAGKGLEEAVLESGAVRLRPIVLTAGAAILASIPITLDPIFSGLAWALIFGLVVSSLFTLVLVPVLWFVVANGRVTKAVPSES